MKKHFYKAFSFFFILGLFIFSLSVSVYAVDLDYSGGSTSNNTGATNTTSGFEISVIDPTYGNNVGYRFSIVDSSGNLKSGSKVVNIYLDNTTYGSAAYSSAQRFIVSSGKVANKKQLASNTKTTSTKSAQSCEHLASKADFYSIPGRNPAVISNWIQDTSDNYLNLQQIYAACGLNLANAGTDDYVLVEPILRVKLAGVITAATPTELAVYGASVSGGGQYNGANGNLSNTGSGTLWNLQYYINREFPNMLYVNKNTSLYSAVSVISSGRYTYNDIIQKGYGCSVLTVKNVITIKTDYTNTITHWKYVGTGGDNGNGTFKNMGTSTFTGKSGNSVTIPSNLVQSYTGYFNNGVAGSYWGTGTWSNKNIGSTFTQPSGAVGMEYYYYPKSVKVVFNKNDGSKDVADQTFTYAVSGNKFGYNNDGTPKWANNSGQFGGWDRTGYTLLGWSESASATTATYSTYSGVADSWINSKVPGSNSSGTVNLYAVWTPNKVNISYNVNGGTLSSSTYSLNSYGHIKINENLYFHQMSYGQSNDPYDAATFGLTKPGYVFAGWKVRSTGQILDQSISYASTVYAYHNDANKTSANTSPVYCYLDAVWTPKSVKVVFNKNDGSGTPSAEQIFTYGVAGNKFGYNNNGTLKWGNSGQFGAWDRTGYTLLGWSESPSATTATYSTYSDVYDSWINSKVPGSNSSGTVNLYAQWSVPVRFDINYDGIGVNYFTPNGISNDLGLYGLPSSAGITASVDSSSGILSLNGTQTASFDLGCTSGLKFVSGEKYTITLTYEGGSYSSQDTEKSAGCFAFDFNKTGLLALDTRKYINLSLPTSTNKTVTATITADDNVAINANGIYAWIWKNGGYNFSNYKFSVKIEKSSSANKYSPCIKNIALDTAIGALPVVKREGYIFKGWYTAPEGGTKVTSETIFTSPTTLYALWESTGVVDSETSDTGSFAFIRFIKHNFLNTLKSYSKWWDEDRYNYLDATLSDDLSDTSDCEQVWYFPANPTTEEKAKGYKSFKEVRDWCLNNPKGTETNVGFLSNFSDNRIQNQ